MSRHYPSPSSLAGRILEMLSEIERMREITTGERSDAWDAAASAATAAHDAIAAALRADDEAAGIEDAIEAGDLARDRAGFLSPVPYPVYVGV